MKQPGLYVVHAAAVRDTAGVNARPGAVLVKDGKVIAAGEPESLPADLVKRAEVIERHDCLLLPQMVNAHTHLELTSIGQQPYDPVGGFVGWVKMLRSHEPASHDELVESAKRGASTCIDSGIQAVGDITRSEDVSRVVYEAGLWGWSYREMFGLGPPFDQHDLNNIREYRTDKDWLKDINRQLPLVSGLQPHAPYSAGDRLYDASCKLLKTAVTHLAETKEEVEFVRSLSGPMFDYVKSLGRWDDAFSGRYGQGLSPVQWMRPYLHERAMRNVLNEPINVWTVVHCNYVSDEDIEILAQTNTSVVYCPIASEYFGHKNHRYREMLSAGINVCLGTDSIICADPNDPQPLGLLSAMRRLYQRDLTDPEILLAMATINGNKAFRMGERFATLQYYPRFVCIKIDRKDTTDPLVQVLTNDSIAEPLVIRHSGG